MTTKSRRKAERAEVPDAPAPEQGDDAADSESAADVRQFVTFMSGDEMFAVDMAPVQEIIRVPAMVRVPLAPRALVGLANLRGRVLPIVSLRRVLGVPDQAHDETTRALVIDLGQPLAFIVDRVASVVSVPTSDVEGVESIKATVNTDMLSGILKHIGGHDVTMVMDFARIIEREFASIAGITGSRHSEAGSTPQDDPETTDGIADELQLVSFNVAGQEYAIAIENVKEIVQVPASIVHVPHSDSTVLGVMTLRESVLPLLSLRALLGLPRQAPDERSRVVIVALGELFVGVVTDSVNEVLRVARSVVEEMPAFLGGGSDAGEITQLCQLDGGKRIVSVIDAARLLQQSADLHATATTVTSDVELEEVEQDDDEQVVVFRLDKEEFGVPIASVQEIVRVPEELTRVPKAPHFVEGVINLRGTVLPVLDLRTRLGIEAVERSDGQRVMVFIIAGTRTGFVVDSVAEVLRIAKSAIEATPRLSADHGTLLSRMANLPRANRMVQLLSPEHLMGDDEQAALASLAA